MHEVTDDLLGVNLSHKVIVTWSFVHGEQQGFMIHPSLIHELNHRESCAS